MFAWKHELYVIANKEGVFVKDLIGPSKTKNLTRIRIQYTKLCRDNGLSYPQIGKILNRDHATIHNYINPKKDKANYILARWSTLLNQGTQVNG